MRFLAVALALVVSAEGIKVKTTDESKEKEGLKWGPYYQWDWCLGGRKRCCHAAWGAGPYVNDSKCR